MSCQNFASTSEGTLAYGVQSACGTVQTTLKELRFVSETIGLTAAVTQSNEIRPNRNVADSIRTSTSIGGNLNMELSYATYNDFLQGLLQSATALDGAGTEIKNGTTKKYFTIEKNTPLADGTGEYTQFMDMQVGGMTLNIAQGAVVAGDFTLMGSANPTNSSTSLDTVGGYTAANVNPVYNSLANVSAVLIDGTTAGNVESVVFTVTNNLREQRAIGSVAPAGVASGYFSVSGTVKIYFASNTLYNKFLADQTFSLSVTLDDLTGATHGNQYTIRLPKCKFTNITKNITGNNQDVLLEGGFSALLDSTLSGTMALSSLAAV
jgi:hypothetical protein